MIKNRHSGVFILVNSCIRCRNEEEGDDQMEKYYCKQCCQIFSDKMMCPQCRMPVEAKIHIEVHHQQVKKDHR